MFKSGLTMSLCFVCEFLWRHSRALNYYAHRTQQPICLLCFSLAFVTEHLGIWLVDAYEICLQHVFLCSRALFRTHIHFRLLRTHKFEQSSSESNWDMIQWILTSKRISTLSPFDCHFWAKTSHRHRQLESNRTHWSASAKQTLNQRQFQFSNGQRSIPMRAVSVSVCLDWDARPFIYFFSHHCQLNFCQLLFSLLVSDSLKPRKCCT